MAETIKLWHFNTLTAYNDANVLGKINYQDISFVKDKTIIITNGATYSGVDLLENSTAIFSKILEGNLINIQQNININGLIESITINVRDHSHIISDIIGLEQILDNIEQLPNGSEENQILFWDNVNQEKIWKVFLEDSLTSSSTDLALTANQGKILKDLIDSKENSLPISSNSEYYFAGDKTWKELPNNTTSGSTNGLFSDANVITDAVNSTIVFNKVNSANKNIIIPQATDVKAGLMAPSEKIKLRNLSEKLPIATTNKLGTVKIGASLQITNDGILNVVTNGNVTPHTHQINDVINLQNTLNNKASLTHTHQISDIVDLSNNLGINNTLTSTSTTLALSANMGRVLDKTSKNMNNIDLDTIKTKGTYYGKTWLNLSNRPVNLPGVLIVNTSLVDGLSDPGINITVIQTFTTEQSMPVTYKRTFISGVWGYWLEEGSYKTMPKILGNIQWEPLSISHTGSVGDMIINPLDVPRPAEAYYNFIVNNSVISPGYSGFLYTIPFQKIIIPENIPNNTVSIHLPSFVIKYKNTLTGTSTPDNQLYTLKTTYIVYQGSTQLYKKEATLEQTTDNNLINLVIDELTIGINTTESITFQLIFTYSGIVNNPNSPTFSIDLILDGSEFCKTSCMFNLIDSTNNVLTPNNFFCLYDQFGLKCDSTGLFKTDSGGSIWTSLF